MRTLALVLLSACTLGDRAATGACPDGEVCSSATPHGLQFFGTAMFDSILQTGPATTAVGGTQDVTIMLNGAGNVASPFDLPFTADGGDAVAVASATGSLVTLRGTAAGFNDLRIVDPNGELYDRTGVEAAAIDQIQLAFGFQTYAADGGGVVFATGSQDIGIALTGKVGQTDERLVDTSMTLATTGATQTAWDTLHWDDAQAGVASVAFTVAGVAQPPLAIEFVAGADLIVLEPPPALAVGQASALCFDAKTGGKLVLGLPDWSFTTDNGTLTGTSFAPGCATLTPAKTGIAHVHASAGGRSLDTDVVVDAAAARLLHAPNAALHPTAGERASLTTP